MPKKRPSVEIPGLEVLLRKLSDLPPEVQEQAVDQVGKFVMSEKVLGWYPKQKNVTRKAAYGKTFFTDKQRRWFWWAFRSGQIDVPYKRTGGFRAGWRMIGSGNQRHIVNDTPGAIYLVAKGRQSRHEQKVGWQLTGERLKANAREIQEHMSGAIKRAMKKVDIGQD